MPTSNFPNGLAFGVNIRGLPVLSTYAGKVFWVDSVHGSDGNRGTFDRSLATIAKAISFCKANNGDIIVVKPKHVETFSAAGALALSTAGISIIGLGTGLQRPHLTLDTANTATITVTAPDIYMENIVLVANFLSIATCFDVTAKNFWVNALSFKDTDSTHNFLRAFKASGAANTADGLRVQNCRNMPKAAGALEMVSFTDNADGVIISDNTMYSAGTASPLVLSAGTKVLTNADISRNRLQMAGTSGNLFISNGGSANSGLICDNYCGNQDVSGAQTFGAAAGMQFFNNLLTSTSTESGALSQAPDTPLS